MGSNHIYAAYEAVPDADRAGSGTVRRNRTYLKRFYRKRSDN